MADGTCDVCGHERAEVHHSRKTGQDICKSCYRKCEQPEHECLRCGRKKIAGLRTEDGKMVCVSCYKYTGENKPVFRPKELCSKCGQEKAVESHDSDGSPICSSCYEKNLRPKTICSKCQQEARVTKYDAEAGAPICQSCYFKTYRRKIHVGVCSGCGQEKRIKILSRMICYNCYGKEKNKTQVPG